MPDTTQAATEAAVAHAVAHPTDPAARAAAVAAFDAELAELHRQEAALHAIPEADGLHFALGFGYRIEVTTHARDVLVECFDAVAGGRVDWALVTADAGTVAAQVATMAAFHEETAQRLGYTGTAPVERPDAAAISLAVVACHLGRDFTTRVELDGEAF